jgi:hypothetical protein
MQTCISCGMPLENQTDIGAEMEKGSACIHCVNADGTLKSCGEIFEGGVAFFLSTGVEDRTLAERITRKNMKLQPAWQDGACDCLQGDEATEEEFQAVLEKL